jgi:hypothetical protein
VRKTFVWDVLTGTEFGKLALKNPEAVSRFVDRIQDWKTKSMNDSFDNTFIDILNNSGFLKRVLARKDKFGTVDKIGTIYNDIKRWSPRTIRSAWTGISPISSFWTNTR